MLRVVFLIALVGILPPGALRAEEPFEDLPLDKALEKAGKENKVVMIDFFTTWCGPCKMLDRSTWPNADVKKLLKEKAISLKVDAEKNRELSMKYRISSYPQIVFIKPDGTEIDRIVGFLPPETFVKDAAGPLAGKDRVTAKRELLTKSPNDPMARLQLADALAQRGKPDEALAEYLWCYDFGTQHRPEFASMRYSSLLGKIAQLSRAYPPATQALEERRATAVEQLMAPLADSPPVGAVKSAESQNKVRDAAVTVLMIDRAMARPANALNVYDSLKSRHDARSVARQAMAMQIVDLLWSARRYDDIVTDAGDAMQRLDDGIAGFTRTTSDPKGRDPRLAEILRQQVTNQMGKYYEALLATGKPEAARALRDKLFQFDSSGRAHSALITHAIRAGNAGEAREVFARGMATLPDKDKALIQSAARNIPEDAKSSAPKASKPAG